MYLNPSDPYGRSANPMSTGQKVGVGVTVLAVGTVGFLLGRKFASGDPVQPSREQNP
jgi:hypothetical protein